MIIRAINYNDMINEAMSEDNGYGYIEVRIFKNYREEQYSRDSFLSMLAAYLPDKRSFLYNNS